METMQTRRDPGIACQGGEGRMDRGANGPVEAI
jgi:hypothetical protein